MKEITFEEAPAVAQTHTIGEALRNVWADPGQFVKNWNYKGAVLSGVLRAPIFLITYLAGRESLRLALGAAAVQFLFRFFFAGVGGTLIQSFRKVEPAWKALAAVMLILPLISHAFEFVIQVLFAYFTSTQDHTDEAILRSITVSIISALFTLFAMRRNVMIVGEEESRSLLHDVSRLPILIFEFCAFIPNEIASFIRRGAWITAGIAILSFGAFAQIMVWALVNRPFWTYSGGQTIPLFKYWGFNGIVLMVLAVIVSLIVFNRKHHR
ncbi:MAG TPA: hypothetical protein VFZ49_01420 [Pyrinomonadaceae bacterium]